MAFVDELRKGRTSLTPAYHRFLLNLNPNDAAIHAFFEGHDDNSFYTGFINQFKGNVQLHTYNCGNKSSVYHAWQLIIQQHPKVNRTLFFVDKDLSDLVSENLPIHNTIFVTELYAVENYLICEEVLRRIITELLRINNVDFDINIIVEHFQKEIAQFYKRITIIMAWAILLRRSGKRPVLNNIEMSRLFHFDGTSRLVKKKLTSEKRLRYLGRVCGVTTSSISWKQIRRVVTELRGLEPKTFVRGKYEAWFLLNFLSQLTTILGAVAKEAGGSVTMKTVIHADNFVEILASRVTIPTSLSSFLTAHL